MANMNIEELHNNFVEYGRNAKAWIERCKLLLPEINRKQVYKLKGFASIYEYAAKLAGLNKNQVREALRIYRNIENKPALLELAKKRGLSSVRPVAVISTLEDQGFWAEKVMSMSRSDLETYVRDYRKSGSRRDFKVVTMVLPCDIAEKLEKLANGDFPELMRKLIRDYERSLEQEKPSPQKTESRHIPKAISHFVRLRANGKCEFPGCFNGISELHHVNRFASEKIHDPDMIRALCRRHHHLAHLGLIGNEQEEPVKWKVLRNADTKSLNRYIDDKVQFYRRI